MAAPNRYPQLILMGDSIIQKSNNLTHGGYAFGAGLEEHCIRRLDIINRGLSGYNTDHVLHILPDLLPTPSCAKVDYILLLFGANDACLPSSPTLQHVPLERYRENIKKIITHPAITAHKPTILLVTPPPINEVHLESEDLQKGRALTRHQRVTSQYASTIREIAAEFKSQDVVLVDIWTALMKQAARLTPGYVEGQGLLGTKELGDNEGLRSLLIDGLHLTGAAYKIFLGEVLPLVGPEWESEPLDFPSWIFPHWSVSPRIE